MANVINAQNCCRYQVSYFLFHFSIVVKNKQPKSKKKDKLCWLLSIERSQTIDFGVHRFLSHSSLIFFLYSFHFTAVIRSFWNEIDRHLYIELNGEEAIARK